MADRQAPNRAQLRKILQAFSPSGFEAFLLDHLPEVHRRLSTGMDKTKQVNLCFELCDNEQVWTALREAAPLMEEAARCLTRQSDPSATQVSDPTMIVLPCPNERFIGRRDALDDVHRLLSKHRAVAIAGLGGVGKSSLMLQYAYEQSERKHYSLVFWMLATDVGAVEHGLLELGQYLRAQGRAGAMPSEREPAQVRRWVLEWLNRERDWLILWDNADDLDSLRQFVPNRRQGFLLCTTRSPDPQTLGMNPYRLHELLPDEAVALLEERSGRSTESPQERVAAETLASTLGYLPLALEQAGAYIARHDCTFSSYLKRYQRQRLDLFPQGHDRASVHTVWSLSFNQVAAECEAAADLLRVSAFWSPDFIPDRLVIEGASAGLLGEHLQHAVAGEEPDLDAIFGPLLRHSLIRRHADRKGYSVHRLVQTFVCHGLGAEHEMRWATRAALTLHAAFPKTVSFTNWAVCQEMVPSTEEFCGHCVRLGLAMPEIARLLTGAAVFLKEQASFQRAIPLVRQALHIWQQVLGNADPDTVESLTAVASLLYELGKPQEAEPLLRRALQIQERTLGPAHPDTAQALNNLALLLHEQGQLQEAELLYRRALQVQEETLGPTHVDAAQSLNNIGTLLHDLGKLQDAADFYRRALQIHQQSLGSTHPDTAKSLSNLGMLLKDQYQFEAASPLLQRALQIREQVLGKSHPNTALSLNNLASLLLQQQQTAEAEKLLQRAIDILEVSLGTDHLWTQRARVNLDALQIANDFY